MRAVISLVVASFMFCCANVQAASNLDAATKQKLVQLEKKYFDRSFDTESDELRAERLEKLVFGEPGTGTSKERIEKLAATIKTDAATSINENDSATKASAPLNDPDISEEDPDAISSKAGFDTYPHVTVLEKAILGQSFLSKPVTERVKNMEMKAFAKSSSNPDLSQRIDLLDQYAEQKLHKKISQQDSAPDSSVDSSANSAVSTNTTDSEDSASPEQTDYPRVTALEEVILGQSFSKEALADRFIRMETKAFGAPSKNPDFSQRTDALERYAEKTLHKKPLNNNREESQRQESAGGSPQPSKLPQILSMVGNSLLGLAGNTMGPGGTSFAGVRMRPRQDMAEVPESNQKAELPEDNPEAYADTPPEPEAKLLVKVSWCEVQVFTKTFPNMHLPERLGQLNKELNFKPGKSNIDLMDDIDAMIKTVQSRKK